MKGDPVFAIKKIGLLGSMLSKHFAAKLPALRRSPFWRPGNGAAAVKFAAKRRGNLNAVFRNPL
jgi:hypothetical protein